MRFTAGLLGALVLSIASVASADETAPASAAKTAGAAGRGAITLPVTTVYGRVQRPVAAVEVSRVRMTLPLTTPTLSGAGKIAEASKKDPF